ncbi:PREDICTED: disease resistance RPP13-like protein 4 isoform X3 [Prunus mume]|uniref:Disease resistance RPP13-like protein 4 isoform X3 n=1 Tax=Prunus mume TaxID=102107 RepID=A0ABM0NTE4_PRUMU|nr:PREDICTED: disease resistance RPP13-like protein 4 isoform X3 [Prunus mume]
MRNVTSTSRNAEKFLPKLLDRLGKAKAKAVAHIKPGDDQEVVLSRFKKIEDELQRMEDLKLLPRVTLWEHTLFSQFTVLERLVDKLFLGDDESNPFNSLEAITDQIKASISLVQLPSYPERSLEFTHRSQPESSLTAVKKLSKELSQKGLEKGIYESRAMANLRRSYEHLEGTELRLCFLSFSIFPEESVIKKRPLIYWWIGEGFITATQDKTAEEVGEEIFGKLMKQGLIQPHGNVNLSTSCTLHPWIRCMLIGLARDALLFHFDSDWPWMPSCQVSLCRRACLVFDQNQTSPGEEDLFTVFNVNSNYLSFKREWLSKLKKVVVLQLGRWQSSPMHHIEVDDEGLFLKGIGAQHYLSFKYLSLRGISGITRIPSCIFNIISLEILDLRACHNLETLPSDISSLRKLTHLDISECYLLEGMPKGIGKLSSLQVLKGFLIANLINTPSRLGDLAKLKKLRRLSIYIGNEAVMHDNEFETLKEISSLRRLKISWAVVSPESRGKIAHQSLDFSFPPDLEKLDLQGIPLKEVPPWLNPRQLTNIKKLYIRGGELCSLDHAGEETVTDCKWRVEILRLKYLSNMKIELTEVEVQFPHLLYLEKVKCHEIEKDKYEKNIFWSKSQGQKLSKA